MILPIISGFSGLKRKRITAFSGLDFSESAPEGSLCSALGIDPAAFPAVVTSPRLLSSPCQGVTAACGDILVRNGYIVKDGEQYGIVGGGYQKAAAIGQFYVFFPGCRFFDAAVRFLPAESDRRVECNVVISGSVVTLSEDHPFLTADGILITGTQSDALNGTFVNVREVSGNTLTLWETVGSYSGQAVLLKAVGDVEPGLALAPGLAVSDGHRLWVSDGERIKACGYDDPFDWSSEDSYTFTPGDRVTGAAMYQGYPTFFTENAVLRVYGDRPSSFRVQKTEVPGLSAGAADTVGHMNGALYYLGSDGVYEYTGSRAKKVSAGMAVSGTGAAVCWDGRYYLSVFGDDPRLFIYDPAKKQFSEGEYVDLTVSTVQNGRLSAYWQDKKYDFSGSRQNLQDPAVWECELNPIALGDPLKKRVTQLGIAYKTLADAHAAVFIRADSGSWEKVGTVGPGSEKTAVFPLKNQRVSRFSVRIEGRGGFTLREVFITFSESGNRF